jgi:hypothetical protein
MDNTIDCYFPILTWTMITSMSIICIIIIVLYLKIIKFITFFENINYSCNLPEKINILFDSLNKKQTQIIQPKYDHDIMY